MTSVGRNKQTYGANFDLIPFKVVLRMWYAGGCKGVGEHRDGSRHSPTPSRHENGLRETGGEQDIEFPRPITGVDVSNRGAADAKRD